MIVLARLKGITGTLDTETDVFTPREWTPEEEIRYGNIVTYEEVVLAKLNDVTGVLNKTTGVFTPRAWTEEENARYNNIVI
jgi:hypothetical protein